MTITSVCGNEARLISSAENLSVIVSSLSFVFKVNIGTSSDGVDCVMGGGWVGGMLDRKEALASVPAGREYQLPIGAGLVLLFLCQCTVALLQPTESLPTF
jgi:hypothetical protein